MDVLSLDLRGNRKIKRGRLEIKQSPTQHKIVELFS